MPRDPRVDAYIKKSADFGPILKHLRSVVHKGCPAVSETVKWGVPAYEFKGELLCMTAAFKTHCRLIFWKSGLIRKSIGESAFYKFTSLDELPPQRTLLTIVKEAARLNAEGVKRPPRPRTAAKPFKVPAYFLAALKKNAKARAAFQAFPPSHKREYVDWINSAKTDETRQRRMATALGWIASGKSRNWKYQ